MWPWPFFGRIKTKPNRALPPIPPPGKYHFKTRGSGPPFPNTNLLQQKPATPPPHQHVHTASQGEGKGAIGEGHAPCHQIRIAVL